MILYEFLNKEYIKYNQENASWKNGLFHAIVVLIIFLLFQPFGFRDKDIELKILLFPGFSLIAFSYSIVRFYIIRKMLQSKKTWALKDEIISHIVGMFPLVFIIQLYSYWITGDMPFNIHWYSTLFYYTTSLLTVVGIIEYLHYSNKSAGVRVGDLSSRIQQYSQQIETAQKENTQENLALTLEKGQFTVNREKLVFIESKGNYLDFHLCKSDGVTTKLTKRGRLHQVEADLENYLEFFRCHRAFIVNMKKAKQMKGNSKNARLILDDDELQEIPVSRTYFKTLTQKLEKMTTL
ncbi:LytR/AlgR family response regulator transcription factor [Maribellus maritimus]|uniref:LytR/AlgR family response regulator transcription factor n=1 Tax=Maribellus maritimus TaxID=2870838 RepID=UPI001EECBC6F|nr:LytTR family DNA-binding domain-containing protein [Maribellus maritimus]MCG6186292.1 LytTR family transcriptional regulator [Maribellus maritimus]